MEKKKVLINGVEYTLDSDNKALLQKMPEVSKPLGNGKREKVQYEYIPIGIIKTLLGGLVDSYDVIDHGAKYTGEEYTKSTTYQDPKTKTQQTKTQELRQYEYNIEYIITNNGVTRRLVGYCRGVASKDILSSDSACNGFFQKLSARATKAALKNYAKIFRMDDEADDVIEGTEYNAPTVDTQSAPEKPYVPKEDKKKSPSAKPAASKSKSQPTEASQSIADQVVAEVAKADEQEKTTEAPTPTQANQDSLDDIKEAIESAFVAVLEKGDATKQDLLVAAKGLKEKYSINDSASELFQFRQKKYMESKEVIESSL